MAADIAVFVLFSLMAELTSRWKPHGIARVQEVDIFMGDSIDGLYLVGTRDGVDSLAFLHYVDIVLASVEQLGLIANLYGRGARGLGLGGMEGREVEFYNQACRGK